MFIFDSARFRKFLMVVVFLAFILIMAQYLATTSSGYKLAGATADLSSSLQAMLSPPIMACRRT
jgi:hypothetical protein